MDDKGVDYVFWFNQGGAVALSVLLLLMCYRVANWLGGQWLIPLRDVIISHFKTVDATLEELMESMRSQRAAIEDLRSAMHKLIDDHDRSKRDA